MRLPSYDATALIEEQDGSRILEPDTWEGALTRYCGDRTHKEGYLFVWEGEEWMKRRMLRSNVTIFAYDRVYRALIGEGDHAILGAVDKPGPDASPEEQAHYELSEEARVFTQGWSDRMDYSWRQIINDATEAKFFGHKLFEKEFGPYPADILPGAVAPTDYAPKPRTVYRFKVDKSNRVLGVLPASGQDPADVLPAANVFVVTMGSTDRDPRGLGTAEPLWKTDRRTERSFTNQDKASDQTGGGYTVVEEAYPKTDANGQAELYDQSVFVPDGGKDENDKPTGKYVGRQRLTAQVMATASTGKAMALLPGQTAKILQGDGAAIFDAILDRGERDVAKAYLGTGRMLNEAQNGSKADTGVAENVGETIRDQDRGIVLEGIRREFRDVLRLNFGDKYDQVVPRYAITTAESTDLAAISNFLKDNFDKLTPDQKNWLISKAGGPLFPEDWDPIGEAQAKAAELQAQYAPDPSQNDPQGQGAGFATFATRGQITNAAAQKRIDNTVRTADRQLRSLVKRAKDGKLDHDAFRERFAYTLSAGHDRAMGIGLNHGGGKTSAESDRYLAETVTSEADYANGLADALFSEEPISLDEANRRIRMYANRMRGTGNEAFRLSSQDGGFTLTWALGGVEFHCAECPQYAEMSPWEPEELSTTPGEGDTPCLSNCKCSLTRSDGREGFKPVQFD